MTIDQKFDRMWTACIAIIVFGVWIIAIVTLSGCGSSSTPTSPSIVATPTTLTSVATAPAEAPVVSVTPPAVPPVAADPPPTSVPPGRAFVRTDCDYSNLSAIRCYNPSGHTLTLSAALTSLDSKTLFGKHENVVIAPGANGYFSFTGVPCGERAQLDLFFGPVVRDVRNPDFTAERGYPGPPCAPPPPPPVCTVQPAGPCGPWISTAVVSTQPAACTPKAWTRSCPQTCNTPSIIEGPIVSCEAPQ